MQYKDIEFVCGGNGGRSPLAEAMGKNYLNKRGLLGKVKVSSSGTLVDFLSNPPDEQLKKIIYPYLPFLICNELLTQNQADDLKKGVNIQRILKPLLEKYGKMERKRVISILNDKNLLEYFDNSRNPQQTKARSDAGIILPLSQQNYERVLEIYSQSSAKPTIKLLGEFKDPFFTNLDEHKKIADKIEIKTIGLLESLI